MSKKKKSEEVPEGYTKIINEDGSSYLSKNIDRYANLNKEPLIHDGGTWHPVRKRTSKYAEGEEIPNPPITMYDVAYLGGRWHVLVNSPFLTGETLKKGDLAEIREDGRAYKVKV